MTEQEVRKGGGGKLSRSETVTVRLDPKLRYLAELAARKQRRTVSSFVEWAVEKALEQVYLDEHTSIDNATPALWDVDDPDRFAKLALTYNYLLTHEEQVLWKVICETGHVWRGRYDDEGEWQWSVQAKNLVYDRLRKFWDDFRKVASGEAGREILPKTSRKEPTGNDDPDIPF